MEGLLHPEMGIGFDSRRFIEMDETSELPQKLEQTFNSPHCIRALMKGSDPQWRECFTQKWELDSTLEVLSRWMKQPNFQEGSALRRK